MTTRRAFMASLLAAGALPATSWADAGNPAYLGAARTKAGGYVLTGLDASGAALFRLPLATRGHAAAVHPSRPELVAFARRPGTYGLVVDALSGAVLHQMQAPEGRHFYGHGVFVAGGDLLLTTENEVETGEGRIGLWSRARGYARIGEMPSGGIGPHDIALLPGGDLLAVANGGIRTHPDHGRDKLNIPTMRPNLSYLDWQRGEVVDQVTLAADLHRNSIRHLAVAPDGTVGFAMQWQGDLFEPVPLLGLHKRGAAPVLAEADIGRQLAMKGYAGSVAFTGRAGASAKGLADTQTDAQAGVKAGSQPPRIGITSPRGGRLHLFDGRTGQFLAEHKRADICGLAAAAGGLVASDGLGGVWHILPDQAPKLLARHDGLAWDNHLIALGRGKG